jgi:transposase
MRETLFAFTPRVRASAGTLTRPRRYPSDLSDAQWAVLEPMLPVPLCGTLMDGGTEQHGRRTMVNVILYVQDNWRKWRALTSYPPWPTACGPLARRKADRVLCSQ